MTPLVYWHFMVISKFDTWGVESVWCLSFLSIPVLIDRKGRGLGSFLHAVKVGVLNASNQRQSMHCHKLKLTEASFSRKCTYLNKSDAIFEGCN